jgi:predicted DNA-binding protein
MAQRATVRISNEAFQKLEYWSKKLGISRGALAGMAIEAGIDALIRAVSPVDSLNDAQLKRFLDVFAEKGVSVDVKSE